MTPKITSTMRRMVNDSEFMAAVNMLINAQDRFRALEQMRRDSRKPWLTKSERDLKARVV